MKQLIIFLPGIMGSELYQGTKLIWPGPPDSLILPYKLMKQLRDPELSVGDIIRRFSISEQYGSLISKFAAAGYSEDNGRLKVCPYDWRKRNEDAAIRLAPMIDTAVADQGGELEITLIAHSMGGLVARYYLESGLFTQRAGFSKVKNLFTLATPHRGSPLALTAAVGLEKRLFLSREQVKELVNLPEFPSLYQLLPPKGDEFAWDDREKDDLYTPLSIYDPNLKLGLSAANLQSARDFRAALNGMPSDVRYFCFTGTSEPTLAQVRIGWGVNNDLQILRVLSPESGDGTVPSWSGGLPGVQGQFVGGEHGTIYKSRDLLLTLGGLLGVKNTLAADLPPIQVTIRDKVMTPGSVAHLSITFPTSTPDFTAAIHVERVTSSENSPEKVFTVESYPIEYKGGVGTEKLGLTFPTPQDAGFYRVRLVQTRDDDSRTRDEFVVQDTVG